GGTPAAGTRGDYPLVLAAANGIGGDAAQAFTLRVDLGAPPVTGVTGVPSGWVKRPVTLTFRAAPAAGGAPVAFTQYQVNGGSWVKGTSVRVRRQGVTTVAYRSVDTLGNV